MRNGQSDSNHKVKVAVRTITPATARRLLAKGSRNFRKRDASQLLNSPRVDAMAEDMAAGRWDLNGEAIVLDSEDFVRDGQHRLAACVKADVPFDTVVVRNVQDGADATIDGGLKRSFGQWLEYEGYKYSSLIAAATRWLVLYERHEGSFDEAVSAHSQHVTIHNQQDVFKRNKGLAEACAYTANALVHIRTGNAGGMAALYYLFSKKDAEMASNYIGVLNGDVQVKSADPVAQFSRYIQRRNVSSQVVARLPKKVFFGLAIKAWNCWRTNTPVRLLKFVATGPNTESVPEIL